MIVGHVGVAAAAARWRPRVSLWWLVPAAVAPDLLDVAYAAAGVCNPLGLYSHTLPAALLLGVCLAGAAVLAGQREAGAVVLLVVLLHLPLDWITGRKLFWPGGEAYGLRLYDRPVIDFVLETAMLLGGWALLRGFRGVPRWSRLAWPVAALVLVQGGMNVRHAFTDRSLKPNACADASRP